MQMTRVKVGDIAAPYPGSVAIGPFGSSLKADMYSSTGVPVVRGQNIREGQGLDMTDAVYVPEDIAERLKRSLVQEGDLIFPHRGAIGTVGIVGRRPLLLSSSMMKLTVDRSQVDPNFLLYYFRGPGHHELMMRASTVGTPGIAQPLSSLRDIDLFIPALRVQRAIAEVLGALDDKIAANTKLAETADELARTWYTELCSSATEWTVLGAFAQNVREIVSPDKASGRYVGLEHIPRRRMWLDDAGSVDEVTSTKARFNAGDILFGRLRPYFHKVVMAPWEGVSSTEIIVIRALREELSGLVLAAASSDQAIMLAKASSEGTRMPRAKWTDIENLEVPAPDPLAQEVSRRIRTLQASVESVIVENRALAQTRDALLPKLMSGKLSVKDAEAVVSEAT